MIILINLLTPPPPFPPKCHNEMKRIRTRDNRNDRNKNTSLEAPGALAYRLQRRTEKNGVFSGHYVIASSLPPERLRPKDDRWNAAEMP